LLPPKARRIILRHKLFEDIDIGGLSVAKSPVDYEAAVYSDISDAMVARLLLAISEDNIPDQRASSCIVAAALLTVAQIVDGNVMPSESEFLKRDGIAHTLANLVVGKTIR
jgi:hypothetical protein